MLTIRWSHSCLILNMGIPIPESDSFYIGTGPGGFVHSKYDLFSTSPTAILHAISSYL